MPDAVTAATVTPGAPAVATPAAEGTPPAGTKPPDPKVEEKKPDPMGPRFAALAREAQKLAKEKQGWAAERTAKEAELKAKEDAIAARAAKAEEWEKAEKAAKSDPGGYLRKLYGDGWYDQLTEFKLKGETAPPADMAVQAVREQALSEVEKVRKEQEERWKKLEDERKSAIEAEKQRLEAEQRQTIETFEAETVDFVKANAEKYELINQTESEGLVVQVIKDTFAKSKRVLTAEEAADAVEKHLEEQAAKVFAGKKWQSRLAQAQKPVDERPGEAARTLTNAAATGASVPSTSGAKKDRIQLAVEAMEAAERAAAGQK